MTLPASGQLTYNEINEELGNSSGSQAAMRAMAAAASKSTPDTVSEFYSYSHGSISVTTASGNYTSGNPHWNTITSTGAWTATKNDSFSIINSFTSSGSGSGKLTASLASGTAPFLRSATITYTLTGSSKTATWTIYIQANQ